MKQPLDIKTALASLDDNTELYFDLLAQIDETTITKNMQQIVECMKI